MTVHQYIQKISRQFQSGIATEHSYRAAFQNYLEALLPNVLVTNEASRTKIGMPDFVLTDKKNIPFAWIETKDIGEKLNDKKHRKQFDRYKQGFDTLIITDYLDFQLFIRGVAQPSIRIAQVEGNAIVPYEDVYVPHTEGVRRFESMIKGLLNRDGVNITIKSAEDLAQRMAEKARTFAYYIARALDINDESFEVADGSLSKQFLSFKQILIGDISHAAFADIYAQTVTYGMFAARLHDQTLQDFSRQEAADLIPKSNPFLRKLFQYVASNDLDDRIRPIVDDLAEVFRHTDVAALLKDFGRSTQQTDPMIHFYETFLAHYDASLRKARGVWYTPQPVVNFIVRAVDEILKNEFDLKAGLADTAKTTIQVKTDNFDTKKQAYKVVDHEVHRVQVLDPACGTGTFLAETVKHIYKRFKNQAGIWNTYVEQHLVPRLHGFELLMASYAMAHIKLDLLLRETGFTAQRQNRFRIFLTNSLEEHHKDAQTLFWGQWLADEAAQADAVKRDAPVMVVLGNPPYAVSSNNKSPWIENLMMDYKKDLNERNIQPLSDDYIKFIRFGQHFIDKNTEGVLAYISNNSFIDGLIHRQMRKSLLESFDKIYILDLHGSAKKQETAPDGSADQNVFDIQQGVSINLFIKNGKKNKDELAEVLYYDMYGNRKAKYDALDNNSLASINWNKLDFAPPQYFFVKKNFDKLDAYQNGFRITELLETFASGILTERDALTIQFEKESLKEIQKDIKELSNEDFRKKWTPKPDGRDWKVSTAQVDIISNKGSIIDILYRPFDLRKTIYSGKTKGFHSYPRYDVMQHCLKDNLVLIFEKSFVHGDFTNIFIAKSLVEGHILGTAFSKGYTAPLYLYSDTDSNDLFSTENTRTPNLNAAILDKISAANGLRFVAEAERDTTTYAPEDVLDYIYAVLHTPQYRARYKEFLKIDFPRVPYPRDGAHWTALVKYGKALRQLHLLDDDAVADINTAYPNGGDNLVGKPKYEDGKVWLNATQYFDNVPETAWQFYIGGYQPAQKWLKDRVGRCLTYEEVLHYQKIILALTKTSKIMEALDVLF